MPDYVKHLVCISDLHVGCMAAICPDPIILDGGIERKPTKLQQWIRQHWRKFWTKHVPKVTGGEPFAVLLNGDTIDGDHHGVTSTFTASPTVQKENAMRLMKPVLSLCGGRLYVTRGTPSHVGESARFEEDLARELCAIPDAAGCHASYEWNLRMCGPKGPVVNAKHHIGAGYTASKGELRDMAEEYGAMGLELPSVVIRSHVHHYVNDCINTARGEMKCVILPPWQLKTEHMHKIKCARNKCAQIGGVVISFDEWGGRVFPCIDFVGPPKASTVTVQRSLSRE